MIRTEGLTKRFGSVVAVDGVDLDVREGDRYGFLGPNGSGKTTTVRMLLGLVLRDVRRRSRCSASRCPARARGAARRRRAGRGAGGYAHLSGADQPGAVRRRRARRSAARPGAAAWTRCSSGSASAGVGRRPVKAYSLGMRQRLGLAAALLRTPRLLVLDEPTNGLDPQGIREIRDLLARAQRGRARRSSCPATCWPRWSAVHPRRRDGPRPAGAAGRPGRRCSAPTGRVVVRTPDPDVAVALLDGRVEHRDGDRLVVRGDDPAELNGAAGAGRRAGSPRLAPERRTPRGRRRSDRPRHGERPDRGRRRPR